MKKNFYESDYKDIHIEERGKIREIYSPGFQERIIKKMGVDVSFEATEYDYTDKSYKDMILYGVHVGQYRNDILAAFAMTADTVVVDFDVYICKRLASELGMDGITCSDDVIKANSMCKKTFGCDIAAWSEKWMEKEAHWEMIADEI